MNENQPQNYDSTDLDRLHAAVQREKPDAQPGREPTPIWVFMASWIVMIFGGGYIGANTLLAGFDFEKSNPFAGKPVDLRPIPHGPDIQLDPMQLAMKKGANVFNNCQGCHQATGVGQPGLIPPLAGSEWITGGTERTARIVLRGLMGPVTVKGASYNNVMPTQGQLSDAELASVLTYVRNSWGNQGTMVTKEMISKVRKEIESHPAPWTATELDSYKDKDMPGDIPAVPGATAAPAAAPAAPAPAAK
ncbi:MAG: cytochrome c [Verrucomicrobiaceae bacterium]